MHYANAILEWTVRICIDHDNWQQQNNIKIIIKMTVIII